MDETTNRQDTNRGNRHQSKTTDHLATKMHETVDRVADTARDAEHQIRSRAAELGERAREQEERALKAAQANLKKATSYVQENPLTSAGIAFVAGLLVSGLMRR